MANVPDLQKVMLGHKIVSLMISLLWYIEGSTRHVFEVLNENDL